MGIAGMKVCAYLCSRKQNEMNTTPMTIRRTMLAIWICCTANGMAEEQQALNWKPILGMELNSEVQATHKGDYNFANLLRLRAALPVTRNLTFELGSLSTCMTASESIGGDLQTFSNLDAGDIPFTLSLLQLAWQPGCGHSLFLGIRNMNEDYFCSPVTALFANSSCGILPTLSANYPIANYPLASVGVHYRYEYKSNDEEEGVFAVQGSLYNGMGYHRFSGRENLFRFCPQSDGVFGLAELQYKHHGSCYFMGTALHYNNSTHVRTSPWIYAEQRVGQNFTLLANYSHAFGQETECRDFLGLGGRYELGRYQLGLFTDYARFAEANEWATELTCRYDINDHLALQPSIHLIQTGHQFLSAYCLRFTLAY